MPTVSVTNTTAALSGKTLAILESIATITALWTFDRGANAPFAVAAASLVVSNLDADKVDGVHIGTMAANRIPYATGATALTSLAGFTFDGTTLTIPGQIAFPATQSASAGANVLDDYEEDNWTPSVGGSATYGANNGGRYTKIGRLVVVQGYLHINAIGTGSTSTVTGLPFTPATIAPGNVGSFASLASNVVFIAAQADTAGNITFPTLAAAGASSGAGTIIGSSTQIYFTLAYIV